LISINNLQSKKFFLHATFFIARPIYRHFFFHTALFFLHETFFYCKTLFFLYDTFFFLVWHFFFWITTFFFCTTLFFFARDFFFFCKFNNFFLSLNLTFGCFYDFNSIIKVLLSEYFFTYSYLVFYFLLIIKNLLFSLYKCSKNYHF
jgi:hypothetical protein